MLILATLIYACCAVGLSGVHAASSKRIALVIGNANYINVPTLDNPTNDANLVAAALEHLGFSLVGGHAQVNLTKKAFDAAVRDFGRESSDASVRVFYYAGHGLQIDGENYLVPIDANPTSRNDVQFEMEAANVILKEMDNSGEHLNILILDACRNNPFGERGFRGIGPGLAEMDRPDGTLISYATQPNSLALDGNRDSPFSLALAAEIVKPGRSILTTFNQIGRDVQKATHGEQQPWIASSPITDEFAFSASNDSTAVLSPGITTTVRPAAQSSHIKPIPATSERVSPIPPSAVGPPSNAKPDSHALQTQRPQSSSGSATALGLPNGDLGSTKSVKHVEVGSPLLLYNAGRSYGFFESLASFSLDGSKLVTLINGSVKIWDVESATQLSELIPDSPLTRLNLYSIAISPDGTKIVTADDTLGVKLWSATTGSLLKVLLPQGRAKSAVFSSDGTRILAAVSEAAVEWDVQTGREIQTLRHHNEVESASFSPDNTLIITACADATARVWDATSGRQTALLKQDDPAVRLNMAWSAKFSPDGNHVLITSSRQYQLWDVKTGAHVTINGADENGYGPGLVYTHDGSAAFSPDGRRIATLRHISQNAAGSLTADGVLKITDSQSGLEVASLQPSESIESFFFSSDGRLITTSAGLSSSIWNASDGTLLTELKQDSAVTLSLFSPNDKKLLSINANGEVRLWKITY